jgi:hypothetical protein
VVWEELILRLSRAGLGPIEDDFIDDYGQFAARHIPRLRDRFFRCTRGRLIVENCRVEAYRFSSESEAEDFLMLMSGEGGRWAIRSTLVLRVEEDREELLDRILTAL